MVAVSCGRKSRIKVARKGPRIFVRSRKMNRLIDRAVGEA